jgi:hypothetical protein
MNFKCFKRVRQSNRVPRIGIHYWANAKVDGLRNSSPGRQRRERFSSVKMQRLVNEGRRNGRAKVLLSLGDRQVGDRRRHFIRASGGRGAKARLGSGGYSLGASPCLASTLCSTVCSSRLLRRDRPGGNRNGSPEHITHDRRWLSTRKQHAAIDRECWHTVHTHLLS